MPRQGKILSMAGSSGKIIDLDEGDVVFNFQVADCITPDLEAGDRVTFVVSGAYDPSGYGGTLAVDITGV